MSAQSDCEKRLHQLEHEIKLLQEETRQSERMKRLLQSSNQRLKAAREKQLVLQRELESKLYEIEKARLLLESIASNDKAVIDTMSEGVMITTPEGLITQVNPAFERITGFPAGMVLGKSPRLLKSGQHDKAFYTALWRELLDHSRWKGEITNRQASGQTYIQETSITAVKDWNGNTVNYVSVMQDVTQRRRNEEKLRELALYDNLTGLANRRLFQEQTITMLHMANRRNLSCAILFFDLDGFKPINDVHGHDAGDHVLSVIAERMRESLRESDAACRYGGDEFAMLLSVADTVEHAIGAAQRLLRKLMQPIHWKSEELVIGASVGVALYPNDGADYRNLLACADARMYQAKQQGKGAVCAG